MSDPSRPPEPAERDGFYDPEDLGWRVPVPAPAPRPRRRWVHLTLFVLTFLTTTLVGADRYLSFASQFGAVDVPADLGLFIRGLWYSLSIIAILGAHEMGHYLACRYYGIDASLPYFIPFPSLFGTLGAVIRIREPILYKRALFDIGVAGPIAGFVVAVPALYLGMRWSTVLPVPDDLFGFELGEPLLFQAAALLVHGDPGPEFAINVHPVAFAAWFGMLATALNLFPIGQLDGGHISYAVLGPRATLVTVASVVVTIALAFFSYSWIIWAVLMIVMLIVIGPRHPRVMDEHAPLDGVRLAIAAFALLMFVLCFTPAPLEPLELIRSP